MRSFAEALHSNTRVNDDEGNRNYLLTCLKALRYSTFDERDFSLTIIKNGITTFESINTPLDTDFFLLAKLYVELSFIYSDKHERAQHLAAFSNAKAALEKCKVRDDNYLRNVIYVKSKEATQEWHFPELKEESLAALQEAVKLHANIVEVTDADIYILTRLYKAQAELHGEDAAKKIACLLELIAALEKVKDKKSDEYQRRVIKGHISLAKAYRLPPQPNFQLAMAQCRAGIGLLELTAKKDDWHYAQLSLFYHNLAMDLKDLQSPSEEVLDAFLTSLKFGDSIKKKTDHDYRGMIKSLYYLAMHYRDENQQYLLLDHIEQAVTLLGSIKLVNEITLERMVTIINSMVEVAFADRQLEEVLFMFNKVIRASEYPVMNELMALLYDMCKRRPETISKQIAVVLEQLITFILNAAKNNTLPDNDIRTRLASNPVDPEPGELQANRNTSQGEKAENKEINSLIEFRVILQELPIHKLSEQIGRSMPFMVAMTARINYLEARVEALTQQLAESKAAAVVQRVESGEPPQKKHAMMFSARKRFI